MSDLIANYGYVAILIGTLLEGETVLVLGGVSAKLGYLDIRLVVLCAFIGSFIGDQCWFWVGRHYGPSLVRRWPSWKPRIERVDELLDKYGTVFMLGFRFVYGLRSISPFAVGMTDFSFTRFLWLNMVAAFLWALIVGLASFALGVVLEHALERFQIIEHYALGTIVLVGLFVWVWHWSRKRREKNSSLLKS